MLYSTTSPTTYKTLAEALRGIPRVPSKRGPSTAPSKSRQNSPNAPSTVPFHYPTS